MRPTFLRLINHKLAAADTPCSCGPSCSCRTPGGSCYAGEKKAGLFDFMKARPQKPKAVEPAPQPMSPEEMEEAAQIFAMMMKNRQRKVLVLDQPKIGTPAKIAAAVTKLAAADTPCSCGCGDTVATCKCSKDCKCRKPGGSCYKAEKKAAQPNSFMGGVTDWANNAIQTPMGQKALGGVASAYNSYIPQVGKKMVSHMMPVSATANQPFKDQSFQHGSFIGGRDTLHKRTTTGPNGSNSTSNLSSQIQRYLPVQVTGTPLQQLGYGLSNNAMPAQTFQQGQNAFLDTKIDNDAITRSHLRSTPGPDLDGNPVKDWTKRSAKKPGLWANIHAKRKRGEKPAKPGDKDYPDSKSWNKTVKSSNDSTAPSFSDKQKETARIFFRHNTAAGRQEAQEAAEANRRAMAARVARAREQARKMREKYEQQNWRSPTYGPPSRQAPTSGPKSILTHAHNSPVETGKALGSLAGLIGGGIYGAVSPGTYIDEKGKKKKRSRLMGALRGGFGYGLFGRFAGGGLGALYGQSGYGKQSAAIKLAKSPAWQRSAGKNEEGGLNAKGRASYNKATGGNLKAPVTEKNPKGKRAKRQNSFCSRMCGMKRKNTGSQAKQDPDSRINKSLRKWNCKCGSLRNLIANASNALRS